jgi:hypothetical protein
MRQPLVFIEYFVTSRGRPIGTTTLSFTRVDSCRRAGWFFPNEDGVDAMAVVAAVLPASLAAHPRRDRGNPDSLTNRRDFARSTEWADLAEAYHQVDRLDLELRCGDGSLVPTESIGIRDTVQLLALFGDDEEDAVLDAESWSDDDSCECSCDLDLDSAADSDLSFDAEWHPSEIEQSWPGDHGWAPDDEVELPRYQIFVELALPDAIP